MHDLPEPIVSMDDDPGAYILRAEVRLNDIFSDMHGSAKLNKTAAMWTGISALLGAATSICGAL